MFTGIIEEVGIVKSVTSHGIGKRITIECTEVLSDTKLGDSISTNGVCLTVTDISKNSFSADVMPETMRMSNLGAFRNGSQVNLERALSLSTRLGGHIVSGHIDCIGKVLSFKTESNAVWVTISIPRDMSKYVIQKGSITLDGISLTVADIQHEIVKVSIIPTTKDETTLLKKNVGDIINVECDVIGKYVEKLFKKNEGSISIDFLKENGFY